MNRLFVHIIYFLIGVLVTLLCLQPNRNEKVGDVIESVTDTLYLTKTDTIREYIVKYKQKKVVDTLYLKDNGNEIKLPIIQTHYSNHGVYDLWVSGYNTLLDSIYTYPKIEYKTITKEITKIVEKNTWGMYPYLGLKRFNGFYTPNIGFAFKSPKKWVYMVEFGLNNDNKPFYGFNIGYNIN